MRRILLRPSWIARHLLALALVGLFLRMGIWQWTKSSSDQGSLQNLFYGVEWPIFAAFVIYWWYRMISEDLRPADPEEPGPIWGHGGRIAPEGPPPSADESAGAAEGAAPAPGGTRPPAAGALATASDAAADEADEELAAYNRYLAALYERDATSQNSNIKGARR